MKLMSPLRAAIALTLIGSATLPLSGAFGQQADSLHLPVVGNAGSEIGKVNLRGGPQGVVLRLELAAGALAPGWHGLHLHAVGDCSDTDKFTNSKGHINHGGKKHGLLNAEGPDDGDLPNIWAAADGSVSAEVYTAGATISDGANALKDADGSALIIHQSEDDHSAQPIGNAGARVACVLIK